MINTLKNILFPKKCVSCGMILPAISDLSGEERVLCGACRGKWEAEKNVRCKKCGKHFYECRCPKDHLFGRGVRVQLKLARYRPGDVDCVANKIIHRMKRKNDSFVFDFAAEQLSRPFFRYVIEKDLDVGDIAVTYVPRSKRSVAVYGYDHARVLAEKMAALASLEAKPFIVRKGKSTEQKQLSKAERIENVKGAFGAAKDIDIRGKTVFVVDDVITSGASMAECAEILRSFGAGDVVALCVASTK